MALVITSDINGRTARETGERDNKMRRGGRQRGKNKKEEGVRGTSPREGPPLDDVLALLTSPLSPPQRVVEHIKGEGMLTKIDDDLGAHGASADRGVVVIGKAEVLDGGAYEEWDKRK